MKTLIPLLLVLGLGCASSTPIRGWYTPRPAKTTVIVVEPGYVGPSYRHVGEAEAIQRSRTLRRGW